MRKSRAFTLVELLVVIGIIALLISILLPSLAAARKQAVQIKCAAAMREIGNAVLLYANANRQWMIPARADSSYDLDGIIYGAPSSVAGVSTTTGAYWPSFLAKYVTNTKLGTVASTDSEAQQAQRSVLWGCPAFIKYESNTIGGYNRVQNGYGLNFCPVYKNDFPAVGVSYPPGWDPVAGVSQGLYSIVSSTNKWQSPKPTAGTWYKLGDYTKPAERLLLVDGQFFSVEAKAAPADGKIPGQKVFNNNKTFSDPPVGDGQTTADWYRHGQFPTGTGGVGTGAYYSPVGGKVAYNILYADGHVVGTSDRSLTYRGVRMRFPG